MLVRTVIDNSEGTGVWTLREIAGRHVAAPTIAAAHQLRISSAFRSQRLKAHEALKLPLPKRLGQDESFDQKEFLKDLKLAVYAGILGSYVQGMHVSRVLGSIMSTPLNLPRPPDHRSSFGGSTLEHQLRQRHWYLEVCHGQIVTTIPLVDVDRCLLQGRMHHPIRWHQRYLATDL